MEKIEAGMGERYKQYFSEFRWNYLPAAILEGYHGEVWVDGGHAPGFVVLALPKLKLYVLGGDPDHPAVKNFLKGLKGMAGFFTASPAWDARLKALFSGKLWELERYAFTSESLDLDYLKTLASTTPQGYRLARLDQDLTERLAAERSEFASDHLVNFESPQDFIERGFGWCLLQGEEIVSVATTFLVCSEGIEIQINTREEHQGRGLGTVTAANLLVESLERGLDPNWDAANKRSGGLARKLGYQPQGEYPMYVNMGSRFMVGFARWGLKVKEFFGK